MQARINRQEAVDLQSIDRQLDVEFAEYERAIEALLASIAKALKRAQKGFLSAEDSAKVRSIYRKLVKQLHPDLHPDLSPAHLELFHRAIDAYKNGDLRTLEMIMALTEGAPEAAGMDSLSLLRKERKRLAVLVEELENEISQTHAKHPFTAEELLQSSSATERKLAELRQTRHALKENLRFLEERLAAMVGTHE